MNGADDQQPDLSTQSITAVSQQLKGIDASSAANEPQKVSDPKVLAKKITESKNLQAEIEKIEDNLQKSQKALEDQKKQITSISALYTKEENPDAKAHLLSAKESAIKKVSDLENHIKLGNKLVQGKKDKIQANKEVKEATREDVVQGAHDLLAESKIKKEEDDKEKEAAAAKAKESDVPKEKTPEQLKADLKDSKKKSAEAQAKAELAERAIAKNRPLIQQAKAQVKRLTTVAEMQKPGSEKHKLAVNILKQAENDVKPLEARLGELQQMKNDAASDEAENIKKQEDAEEKLKSKDADAAEVKKNIEDAKKKTMNLTKHQELLYDHVQQAQASQDALKRATQNAKRIANEHKEATKFVSRAKPAEKEDLDDDQIAEQEQKKLDEKKNKLVKKEKVVVDKKETASDKKETAADKKDSAKAKPAAAASLAKTETATSMASFMKTETSEYQSKMDKLTHDFEESMKKIDGELKMAEQKEDKAHEHLMKLQEEQHKHDADHTKQRRLSLKKKLDAKKKSAAPKTAPMSLVQRKKKNTSSKSTKQQARMKREKALQRKRLAEKKLRELRERRRREQQKREEDEEEERDDEDEN